MNTQNENSSDSGSSDTTSDSISSSSSDTSEEQTNQDMNYESNESEDELTMEENFPPPEDNDRHSTAVDNDHPFIRPRRQQHASSGTLNDTQMFLKASAMKIPAMSKKTDPKEQQREWKKYKDTIKQFFSIASGFDTAKSKLSYMKLFCGEEIRDALLRVKIKKSNKTEKQKFKDIIETLDNHFDAGINTQGFLKDFYNTKQNESESFVKFIHRLKNAAIDAEISQKNFEDAIIVQAVAGTRINKLKSADVYSKKTLKELEQLATTFEMDEKGNKEMESVKDDETKREVLAVGNYQQGRNVATSYQRFPQRGRGNYYHYERPYSRPQGNDDFKYGRGMRGRYRYRGRGYAYGNQFSNKNDQRCYNCNRAGHIARNCLFRVNNVEEKTVKKHDELIEIISLGKTDKSIEILIDTGSEVNTITVEDWKSLAELKEARLFNIKVGNDGENLSGYGGGRLTVIASFWTTIQTKLGNESFEKFYVIQEAKIGLLCYETAMKLGLIKRISKVSAKQILTLKKSTEEMKLTPFPVMPIKPIVLKLKADAVPNRCCSYQIPLPLREREEVAIINPQPGNMGSTYQPKWYKVIRRDKADIYLENGNTELRRNIGDVIIRPARESTSLINPPSFLYSQEHEVNLTPPPAKRIRRENPKYNDPDFTK
ncbi:CLUMA_CG002881, isoform A [Clunio marinus]|uniref:CLUMA_CG002881, isoform A n=1 Tax=Clunio marinus TaxID=568069 RepID=A0A1J1HRL7_9DIPT|nr:CLUMA_CG002881, isoform A [Clunio marinus]